MLPLPRERVQATSLENHLAFAVAKAGQARSEQVSRLMRMVYLAYCMRAEMGLVGNREPYRQAERALEQCIERSIDSQAWTFPASPISRWLTH